MKCEQFGTQDCGTERYDGCAISDECEELAQKIVQGKAKILDPDIMNEIEKQDTRFTQKG